MKEDELTMFCNNCGRTENTDESEFNAALAYLEDFGWKHIYLNGDCHTFCCKDCFESFATEELEDFCKLPEQRT